IHQHDIGLRLPDKAHRCLAIGGLAYQFKAFGYLLQHHPQSFANHGMIINNHDADIFTQSNPPRWFWEKQSRMTVPAPGALLTSSVPPDRRARSRRPTSPKWPAWVVAATDSKPTPSSRTSRVSPHAFLAMLTHTCCA